MRQILTVEMFTILFFLVFKSLSHIREKSVSKSEKKLHQYVYSARKKLQYHKRS